MSCSKRYLPEDWDVQEQTQRAFFMNHMYKCSGRDNPEHPMHGLYTGLWQDFCLKEAGPYARDVFFERLKAQFDYEQMIREQREQELQEAEDFKATIEDLAKELHARDEQEEFIGGFHD